MATVSTPSETPTRVRHPLDAVRSHIRRYVFLETAASVLFFLALWFWIGLFIDYGTFFATAYDWILELNFIDIGGQAARGIRIGIAACIVIGLGYLVATKLFVRLFKEFSDPAVALVLERRFPKELGDRLITAVELADAKKAESYGFSGQMLAKTINEAAERVERVPVQQVFDWARMRRQWLRVGFATIGMFVLVMGLTLGVRAARGQEVSPIDDLWRFRDVASIWIERNVLMQDSYWLRNSQLEIVRFQDTPKHPGEMRIGRDDARPELVVRAVSWVAPDSSAIGGWRGLKISDLDSLLTTGQVNAIPIPADWPGWVVELDDLDVAIPTGTVPATWNGKTAGEVAKELAADAALRDQLTKAGALASVGALGDWKTWSVDKLFAQLDRPEIQEKLEADHPGATAKINELKTSLEELAASPRMARRIRKLDKPDQVGIEFRGATTRSSSPGVPKEGRFVFGLGDLKESASFYVHGGDYFTPPLRITLAPPPAVREITIEKQEPAYLYHWLAGSQEPLKGKKQVFKGGKVSVTGETSAIDVPLGTDLTLKASVDRPLKDGIRIAPAGTVREPGVVVPESSVTRDPDGMGFTVHFEKVDRPMEFQFEFFDEDSVRGKRRVRIRPVDDQSPEILNFELGVVLRKPRFKEGLARSLSGSGAQDGLLVTPNALLPFGGTVRDDVALTNLRWLFDTQPITIEAGTGKDPGRVIVESNPVLRRSSLIASAFQYSPISSLQAMGSPGYFNFLSRVIAADLKQKQPDTERSAPLTAFEEALKAVPEESLAQAEENLTQKPAKKPFLREHSLRDRNETFDLRQRLADLPMKDKTTQAPMFHILKLSVAATDNNVETGPSVSKTRSPIFFLVVPETELLAQIGLEEEVLRERLEKVVQKLKTAQTTMAAQLPMLRSATPETDHSLVLLRVDEVRKAVLDTASTTREIFADYSRIMQELQVNRVKKDKISDVQNKIVQPLELIVNPTFGGFSLTDDVIQRLASGLDDDIANKRVLPNLPKHLEAATQTNDQLISLIDQLDSILKAIDSGLDFNELVSRAVAVHQGQVQLTEPLRQIHDTELERILKSLID